jgi:hypothetical protein
MSINKSEVPSEPSAEQCNLHAPLGGGWYALWYPQMGGYVGKAAVYVGGADGCVEIAVWHDGTFPFGGDDVPPVVIHHCDVGQFREFANTVEALQEREP